MTIIISVVSLILYFIWGQGFVCAWWMYLIFGGLGLLVLTNKLPWLQWILSLFLLYVTFIAPPTFGYSVVQRNCYNRGLETGSMVKRLGMDQDAESAWDLFCDQAGGDKVPECEDFYMRGWDDAD